MKKHIIFNLFLSLMAFQIVATPTNAAAPFDWGKKVDLLAGTVIQLELAEEVQSNDLTVGQIIKFKVKMDVMVDERIAIRTGAHALGRVKSINKTTYNNPAKLTIELTTVQAVDGQQIPLNGDEQTIKGDFPNQGTTGRIGKAISATVMNNMDVETN